MAIALAMMSRAPEEVVARAMESARSFVDRAVLVVAPGSHLLGLEAPIPTRIVEQPWMGYASTRTFTLHAAEQDPDVEWVVMIDSYSTLDGKLPELSQDADAFEIAVEDVGSRWRWMRNGHMMRARKGFSWEGIGESGLHEVLRVPLGCKVRSWPGLVLRAHASPKPPGSSRTYADDAERLRQELERDPSNARAAFYYAQSLKDAGRYREAFDAYDLRARMAHGWNEETFWALLWKAKLAPFIGEDPVPLYLAAHQHSPHRAEPLSALEWHFRNSGRIDLAMLYGCRAAACPYPTKARLFVDLNAYSPEALEAAGIAA
jgi:hypothetical protein